MVHHLRRIGVAAVLLAATLLTACGTTTGNTHNNGVVQIVAAEDFWGSIAAQVGGNAVKVTSIITNPDTDPHTYQPTTSDANLFASAQYVITNGAGYDGWADKLINANTVDGRKVLKISDLVGKKEGDNPHLWYNPDYVTAVVMRVRDDLIALAPNARDSISGSAQSFLTTGLQSYHDIITSIKTTYAGTPVGATESIFSYLAPALGLNLITPYTFLKAVSEGEDVAATDEATVEQQIKTRTITILVYNSQNTPNAIQTLIRLAKDNGIPVTTITETLSPAGTSFQDWQTAQLMGIRNALAQATGK